MEEIFKPIKGFEGAYEVSNLGRVKSLSRMIKTSVTASGVRKMKERILSSPDRGNGYPFVDLRMDNKKRQASIHTLVAEAFLPNPNNFPQVNHINGIKSDFRLENLEWNTASEDAFHAFKLGLRKTLRGADDPKSKKVCQYTLDGKLVKKWDAIILAKRDGGFCSTAISACCKRKKYHNTHAGFIFRYDGEAV